jgi:prevent-host-death family protein
MKTISATEAKNRLGSFLGAVSRGGDEIVIESHGKPTAVLISYDVYREFREMQDRQRRQEAIDALWRLRDEVQAKNRDLTAEEADAIADEIADEAMSRVVARARLRWAERAR